MNNDTLTILNNINNDINETYDIITTINTTGTLTANNISTSLITKDINISGNVNLNNGTIQNIQNLNCSFLKTQPFGLVTTSSNNITYGRYFPTGYINNSFSPGNWPTNAGNTSPNFYFIRDTNYQIYGNWIYQYTTDIPNSYRLIIPITGLYSISFCFSAFGEFSGENGPFVQLFISKNTGTQTMANNDDFVYPNNLALSGRLGAATISTITKLNAGDYINYGFRLTGTTWLDYTSDRTYSAGSIVFNIFLVQRL